jgi:hypothetical protein
VKYWGLENDLPESTGIAQPILEIKPKKRKKKKKKKKRKSRSVPSRSTGPTGIA